MDPDPADLYLKKQVRVRWGQQQVALDIPVDAFSSFQVDRGTQLLLREIERSGPRWGRALDLGCGYGPIALWLAATGVADEVHAIDRDALAVAFTARNAERNGLANILARGGLAYDDPPAPACDAIVTNLPAKAGQPVHRLMLLGAAEHLTPGGDVWAVAVQPLEEQIDALLAHESVRPIRKIRKREHVVYAYSFAGRPPPPAGAYERGSALFEWGGVAYSMTSVFGLPEFDTLSRTTELVLACAAEALKGAEPEHVAVWDPGQGHIPVVLSRLRDSIRGFTLLSRDLLSLRAARANLRQNGFRGEVREHHTADVAVLKGSGEPGLIVGTLREGERMGVAVEKLARAHLQHPGVPVVMGCSSSFGARVVRRLRKRGVRASVGRKRRGSCSILCGQAGR